MKTHLIPSSCGQGGTPLEIYIPLSSSNRFMKVSCDLTLKPRRMVFQWVIVFLLTWREIPLNMDVKLTCKCGIHFHHLGWLGKRTKKVTVHALINVITRNDFIRDTTLLVRVIRSVPETWTPVIICSLGSSFDSWRCVDLFSSERKVESFATL